MKKIAVVDDSITNLKIAERALKDNYRTILLISGAQILKYLSKNTPDLILLDINMPEMDGFETLKEIKKIPQAADIPVIFLTANSDPDTESKGFELGAVDFISKPFVPKTMISRINTHLELVDYQNDLKSIIREKTRQIENVQDALVMSLAELVDCRDELTGGHTRRTAHYLGLLLEALHERGMFPETLDDEYIHRLKRCAILHDIGKVGISDATLLKPARLSDEEMEYMRQHTVMGKKILDKAISIIGEDTFLTSARELAYCHHERWDGKGYPRGLAGEDIPLGARIIFIADVYDALTSKRSYKEPFTHEKAVQIIVEDKGKGFDPRVVSVFEEIEYQFKESLERFRKGE